MVDRKNRVMRVSGSGASRDICPPSGAETPCVVALQCVGFRGGSIKMQCTRM